MKTLPIQPAQVQFDDPAHAGTPYAPAFGDVYHARAGALAQARHVFLAGNGLPQRWQQRQRFVVLETGFGLGNNFLATWQAWREDAQRCEQLVFISVEKHPLRPADLARAHAQHALPELAQQLVAQWPPLTPDLHQLTFEEGRVRLLLAFGDAHIWLPELVAEVNAFYLDGFAPDRNADMWDARLFKACARLAAPGATAATWSVARDVRDGLAAAGCEVRHAPGFGTKRTMTVAQWPDTARHPRLPVPPGRQAAPNARSALVIGAGLAGAAVARALAAQGLTVTVLERRAAPAQETSGNPAGIFHPVVHAHDGAHAQLLRAGALRTAQLLRGPIERGELPGAVTGLLRGQASDDEASTTEPDNGLDTLQHLIQRHHLPPDYVQAWTPHQAQAHIHAPLASSAWFYPSSGWVSPPALVRHWLHHPAVTLRPHTEVTQLRPCNSGWQALDAAGTALAEADVVVLTCAHQLVPLLAHHNPDASQWPLERSRGQVTWWPPSQASHTGLPCPTLPVASGGYLIAPPDGSLLCGATNQPHDDDPTVREADHHQNLARVAELMGHPVNVAQAMATPPHGRVGWRMVSDDRLPVVGPVPLAWANLSTYRRLEQPRQVPRLTGLYVLGALGSRGLSLAPLLGEALAAHICGAPHPLSASLWDAVDAARFVTRRVRKGEKPC